MTIVTQGHLPGMLLTPGEVERLSLRLDESRLCEFESATDGSRGPLSYENLSWAGSLLEPGRDVDRIARDEGASLARPPDDDLPGVHADT